MLRLLNRLLPGRGGFDYKAYWERRYRGGGDSGRGSRGSLARYKADVINDFVERHGIRSVIEFGCGDGAQLGCMRYPSYLGLDVSPAAIAACSERFASDPTRRFAPYRPGRRDPSLRAELVVCLDVLYHVVDDEDFERTLADVFASAERYVILYTNVAPRRSGPFPHVRYRDTLAHLARHSDFALEAVLANQHPRRTSAQFIVLERQKAP